MDAILKKKALLFLAFPPGKIHVFGLNQYQ